MKRILIICNYFAPYNEVAAIRITKLARYMKSSGYDVSVLCEKRTGGVEDEILKKDAEGIRVLRIENSARIKKLLSFLTDRMKGIKEKKYEDLDHRVRLNRDSGNYEFYPFETAYPVIGSIDYLLELLRQYDLFTKAVKFLKEHGEYDYCLSSYGDYFGLLAGRYYKKRHPLTRWIFDIRDPVCRYKFTPDYVRPIAAHLEKTACTSADAITAVTRHLCGLYKKHNPNTYFIPNGFDRSDRVGLKARRLSGDRLCFVYTGSMYGGLQDFSILFSCIRELSEGGKLDINRMEFHFAGRETAFPVFQKQAAKYGLGENCVNHGRLPRKESLELQMGADILLACGWDYKAGLVGNISGKLLEYMSAGRPVILIMNGDTKRNEVSIIMNKCRLGFVYEQANHDRDKKALNAYLTRKYEEFRSEGHIRFEADQEETGRFDYRILSKKMAAVLKGRGGKGK